MTSPNTIIADLTTEVETLRKQRDELLEAIEELAHVLANIGMTSGIFDDETLVLHKVCRVIDGVKGGS